MIQGANCAPVVMTDKRAGTALHNKLLATPLSSLLCNLAATSGAHTALPVYFIGFNIVIGMMRLYVSLVTTVLVLCHI